MFTINLIKKSSRNYLLFLFILLPLLIFGQNTKNVRNRNESEQYAEKAWKLYESGKPQEALNNALQAIFYDDEYCEGYFWAGLAYDDLKDNENAIKYLEKAVQLNPDASFNFYLGKTYLKSNDKDRAIPVLEKAIKLDKDLIEPLDLLGRYYLYTKKETEKSLPYLKKYVKRNMNEYSLYNTGIALNRLKLFEDALKVFNDAKKYIEINKNTDKWIIDNVNWAIDMTNKNEVLDF